MKSKTYMFALLPLSVLAFALRIVQVLLGIDASTQFFVDGSAVNWIFHIFLVLFLLFFLSGLFVLKPEKKPLDRAIVRIKGIDKTVFLVYAVFVLASELFALYSNIASSTVSVLAVFRTLAGVLLFTYVAAFVSAPKRVTKLLAFKFLALMFPVYYTMRLVDVFVSEKMIYLSYKGPHVLLYASAALFYLFYAKATAGMYARKGVVVFGCTTVLLCAVNVGNLFAVLLSGGEYALNQSLLSFVADVLFAVTAYLIMQKPFVRKTEALPTETVSNEK